ncbi:MAG TPA: hypothetical protein VGO54_07275 [Bradyrhizobium sp.]|nr:hypothetical protein [Bradyrhizobium sp.]
MAPQTKLGPYDEAMAGESGLDDGGPELTFYGPHRPVEPEAELPPEDQIPLFLSGQDEEKAPRRIVTPRRILKAAALAAVAAASVFVILSRENPRDLFSSAKASLPAPASQSSAAPSSPAVRLAGDSRTSSANAMVPPTRDEMAAALRAAHESVAPRPSQSEIRQPPAQAAAAPAAPPRRMDADELATLLNRAKGLIAIGDIAPARLLLERAADAQEAGAALLLAQTYDPAVLGTQDLRSITPDPAMARTWYQTAARLGSLDAQQRLAQMQK